MKQALNDLFEQAIKSLQEAGEIPVEHEVKLMFERARNKDYGDYATNVALTLAKPLSKNPRDLAAAIVENLPTDLLIANVDIAGPGFINIFLANNARQVVISQVLAKQDSYGLAPENTGRKIMVEFVSANPTGPLHVGHGRGAAYGDTLARLLTAAGHRVEREYYVNDAGRQMDILATSVWLRYLHALGVDFAMPENGYQGQYIVEMANDLLARHGDTYQLSLHQLELAKADLDGEAALDAIIAKAKSHLGEDGYQVFFRRALDEILNDIRQDLSAFGVDFDVWFSERSLFDAGKIQAVVEQLKESSHVYEKGGAWWFRSTDFGDEKDRVVVRDNGQPTYFASDIAYHKDKVDRGFDECINIWGADHHGYISRVKASMQALSLDPKKLNVLLVQFATLWRGGEKVKMSTRSGSFVTLRELREEVGTQAARFFYAQRKSEQHMDFDLDLAKSHSNENPVFYVQYAHARICSVFREADERSIKTDVSNADLTLLDGEHEKSLMTLLERFPELITQAANSYEPHQIAYFLRDLATAFHSWYNASNFLDAEQSHRLAMLALCAATKQVLANGLNILGVTAAEKM